MVNEHPSVGMIRLIQDKYRRKEHLKDKGYPISEFGRVDSTVESVTDTAKKLGLPLMLKSRTLAYDGRGNFVLKGLERAQVQEAIDALGNRELSAETWVPFGKEIAVMVVRSRDGTVVLYPTVGTVHKDNI